MFRGTISHGRARLRRRAGRLSGRRAGRRRTIRSPTPRPAWRRLCLGDEAGARASIERSLQLDPNQPMLQQMLRSDATASRPSPTLPSSFESSSRIVTTTVKSPFFSRRFIV